MRVKTDAQILKELDELNSDRGLIKSMQRFNRRICDGCIFRKLVDDDNRHHERNE